MYVFVSTNMPQNICGGHRSTCSSQFSISTLWFIWIKHSLLDLMASIFSGQPSHWTLCYLSITIQFLYFVQFGNLHCVIIFLLLICCHFLILSSLYSFFQHKYHFYQNILLLFLQFISKPVPFSLIRQGVYLL